MPPTSLRETHVRRDYDILRQEAQVTINDAATRITIHGFNYPDGWQPGTAALLLRYPDPYPRMQPAVYIPKDLHYGGHVAHRQPATDSLQDGWVRWCTHHLDWQTWREAAQRKDQFPIIAFLGLIRDSLLHPHADNPIAHAQRQR